MTRIYDQPRKGGGTRLLILGSAAYPHAAVQKLKVPKLNPISSAGLSAEVFAKTVLSDWEGQFAKPLASVDFLVDSPDRPGGILFTGADGIERNIDPPTMANVKNARRTWMLDAGPDDILIFYCCGHGIWLPATGKTFLTASFGQDPDNPWADAVALDDFAFALGEYAPRHQWLIFDCCNNTPTDVLKAMGARADALLVSIEGQRKQMEQAHGLLSQVTVSSSSPGAQSFGKDNRPSRFMEAFLEACSGAGCRRPVGEKWWVDQQGIEEAIATYRFRVAPIEEEDYFLFPRVTQTDAADVPRFLWRNEKPQCTLFVRSQPAYRLKQAGLTISCRSTGQTVAQELPGAGALSRYRVQVAPWLDYDLKASFASGVVDRQAFAMPPLAETLFEDQ